jgi:lipoprotein-anchoring transpeptidase ErfK/SrfK
MHLRRIAAVALTVLTLVGAGCSGSRPTLSEPKQHAATTSAGPTTTIDSGVSQVATAREAESEVKVYLTPDATRQAAFELSNPNPNGAPLVFLVKEQQGSWYHVYLPVRPNGSNGWVRASDVTVQDNPYRIIVSADAHRLTLEKDGVVQRRFKVGIGRGEYPTPGGVYYIKELLAPPDPDGAYGPYAYGLSGFSEIKELENFEGGDGVIGIHGTNDPSSVGANVSHGCIRMYNDDITALSKILPLGTPVTIEA